MILYNSLSASVNKLLKSLLNHNIFVKIQFSDVFNILIFLCFETFLSKVQINNSVSMNDAYQKLWYNATSAYLPECIRLY